MHCRSRCNRTWPRSSGPSGSSSVTSRRQRRILLRCRELFRRAQVQPSIVVRTCLEGGARLDLRAHRFVEAEQLLQPLLAAWERVNPEAPGHGEALHWLAEAERGEGKLAAARRDAERADVMLRRSPLPALRRLVHGPRKSGSE